MEPLKSSTVCDTSAPHEARIASLIKQVPRAELPGLFSDQAAGVPSLNIPFYNWWSEALHGVSRCPYNGSGCCAYDQATGAMKCASSFPAGIATSCSFNDTLFRAVGSAAGTEARAMSNAGIAS
eukprot:SAG22_NODE_14580_length_371_cov_0.573529_1_plen_123_part_11